MPRVFLILLLLFASCAKAQTIDEKMEPTPVMQAGIRFLEESRQFYPFDMEELEKFVAHVRKNGYANDYYIMGMMYVDGRLPKGKFDARTARSYFEKAVAAYSCHANALLMLSLSYTDGVGDVEIDMGKGISLLERAGECGSKVAYANLGNMYVNGAKGIRKDTERAKKYFEKSAHLGHAESMIVMENWEYFVKIRTR